MKMESNIAASRPKASSAAAAAAASNQAAEAISVENRFSYDDIFATASNSKVYFQELSKNAQAAENNFDMVMKQWQEAKSRSQMESSYDRSEPALSQSTSSYNSIKNMSSENSAPKITEDGCEREERPMADDPQLQVVLTPRTPKEEEEEEEEEGEGDEEEEEAEQVVVAKNSLSSVKTTSKRPKKAAKWSRKKSPKPAKTSDEQQTRTSLIYSAKAKRRKLHGRLKNSNSKSTIATRDTGFSDKKVDRRKFKRQTSLDTLSGLQAPAQVRKRAGALKARESKQLQDSSKADVVEVLHSRVSARSAAQPGGSRLSRDVARTVAEAKRRKPRAPPVRRKTHSPRDDPQPQVHSQHPSAQASGEERISEQCAVGPQERAQQAAQEYEAPACVEEAFYPRNYELPTMASELKRVRRPCYQHFDIRNIPFVVGTSLSPSHNLGLNIQQVLSIIKMKQPAVPGVSALLIRKVSRGVRPVCSLFERVNDRCARTYRQLGRRRSARSQQRIASLSCEQLLRASSSLLQANQPASAAFKQQQQQQQPNLVCEPLYEEDEDNDSTCSDSRTRNGLQQQQQQQDRCSRARKHQHQHQHCQHQHQHGGSENGSNFGARASSNKQISEVFTRLYDQFDKMVSQHERLKEQLEKRKDKSLLKEVSELESAMTRQEQEISAVVNLYNEVTSLKKQMKLLHERNSFVCIATPDPSFQSGPANLRARTAPGPYLDAKPSRRSHMPNALKLVGLLRQMQAFQRQLALA